MAKKVLLVDDEIDFVEALAERLRGRGLVIEIAHEGRDALERVAAGSFDAVILDLAMPGMDGIETLAGLLSESPDLRVILLTGHATIKAAMAATQLGAVEVLEKPVDIATLMEKIAGPAAG